MNSLLGQDAVVNEWLGTYLTTPLRMRLHKPRPFFIDPSFIEASQETYNDLFESSMLRYNREDEEDYEDEDDEDDEANWKPDEASSKIFPNPRAVIDAVTAKKIRLQRFGGLKILHDGKRMIFVNGDVLTIKDFPLDAKRFYDYSSIDSNTITDTTTTTPVMR
jgi:hypothetical protein